MYGIVNKAIQELITEKFGQEKWEQVKAKSGLEIDGFVSNHQYDDAVMFQLAEAASSVLSLSTDKILHDFGRHWVLQTGRQHYGPLMSAGGLNLRDFLINLPNFHSRVMLLYPDITPPEFKTNVISDTEIRLHYISIRTGLTSFARGFVQGLADTFQEKVTVNVLQAKEDNHPNDVFQILW